MKIEYSELFDKAIKDGINLFLGAGFSLNAKNINGDSLPLGNTLANELAEYFNTPNLDLPKVAAIIESRNKEEFYTFLRNRFSIGDFDKRYYNIEHCNIKGIYTTNIDDLIYKILESSSNHYINDTTIQGPSFKEKKAIDYYPLHGSILNRTRP